jgi:hypothetical protein
MIFEAPFRLEGVDGCLTVSITPPPILYNAMIRHVLLWHTEHLVNAGGRYGVTATHNVSSTKTLLFKSNLVVGNPVFLCVQILRDLRNVFFVLILYHAAQALPP